MKKDRNGNVHKSGIDNPNFALDFPFALSFSDGHEEDWEYFKTHIEAKQRFEECKLPQNDIHFYEYNMDFGYEVIDSYCGEEVNN